MKKIRVLPYGYEYKDGIISNKEEEYIVVREIFNSYCKGNSLLKIAQFLNQRKIEYQPGTVGWNKARLKRILEDERYLGKRNFPQIVSEDLYQACNGIKQAKNKQENTDRKNEIYHLNVPIECPHCNSEMLRRGKTPDIPVSRWFCKMPNCTTVIRKQVGAKTELGKYCGKYALTELLVCGECKTPYRRCTWTVKGKKKIVWRCISRLDFGKKYCHNSPTIEEGVLHEAIMEAIQRSALLSEETLQTLKEHIRLALGSAEKEENSIDIEFRIAQIDAEFNSMIDTASADTMDGFDENRIQQLSNEKNELQKKLRLIHKEKGSPITTQARLDSIYTVIDGLKNCPMAYNDEVVRKLVECVVIESKDQIKVVFRDGMEMEQTLKNENIHWLTNLMLQ